MQNIIIQNNKFLNYLAIVSISDVKHEEADNVFAILSEAELISGMEKTRKSDDESSYWLQQHPKNTKPKSKQMHSYREILHEYIIRTLSPSSNKIQKITMT